QADEDYIVIANFVDRHLDRAASWIHSRYKSVDGFAVSPLAQSLLWQGRQLNVEAAHRSDDASQIDAIFADPPGRTSIDNDQEWNEFLAELISHRRLLRDELLSRTAAFQGTGTTPYAVDASQLLQIIQDFRKAWKVSEK